MRKKYSVLIIIIVLLVTKLFFVYAEDEENQSISRSVNWVDVNNPENYRATFKVYKDSADVKISCIEDLVDLSLSVADGNTYEGKNIVLTKSLDFEDDSSYKDATRTDYGDLNGDGNPESIKAEMTSGNGFMPIGNYVDPFSGNFQGRENEIRNIYIDNTETRPVGIFGCIKNATIQGLTVSGRVKAIVVAGGIVGRADDSTIANCHNNAIVSSNFEAGGIVGYIQNSRIANCYNTNNIQGSSYSGGIVADAYRGSIYKCYNNGEINVESKSFLQTVFNSSTNTREQVLQTNCYFGGIVAHCDYLYIGECYNTAKITVVKNEEIPLEHAAPIDHIGGIVGGATFNSTFNNIIKNCYNEGEINRVSGNYFNGLWVGGIAGYISGKPSSEYNKKILVNCYNTGNINSSFDNDIDKPTVQNYVGGIVGATYADRRIEIENCYNAGTVEGVRADNIVMSIYDSRTTTPHVLAQYVDELVGVDLHNGPTMGISNCFILGEGGTHKGAKYVSAGYMKSMAFVNELNNNASSITDVAGLVEWIYVENRYPKLDIKIENEQAEGLEYEKEETIQGNGTIEFKGYSKEEYNCVCTGVVRYDAATNEWKILEKNVDYKEETNGNITELRLIGKQKTIDGIIYSLNPWEGTASVIGMESNVEGNGELTIPKTLILNDGNYEVIKIASKAFEGKLFDGFSLPDSIESIEEKAFEGCSNLTEITIPKSVSSLHINAFSTHNVNVNIHPDNPYYYITDGILYSKDGTTLYGATRAVNAESFIVPDNVTEIRENAFSYYGNLKEITIGKNVVSIAPNAFDSIKETLTITGYKHSYAEQYANENNINFNAIYTGFFIWEEDNYNFTNSKPPISGYYIGNDIYNRLANSYKEEYNNDEDVKNGTWGGSCEGMAQSTILMKYGFLTPQYWQISGKEANYEYQLEYNNNLLYMINFYQMFQGTTRALMFSQTDISNQGEYEGFFNGVKNAYENTTDRLLLCTFYWTEIKDGKEKFCGHAIVIINGPETLNEQFYANHSSVFSYYRYRIPVYDVNSLEEKYIYISEDFSKLTIGSDSKLGDYAINASSADGAGKINGINAYIFNPNSVVNIQNIIANDEYGIFQDGVRTVEYNMENGIRVSNGKGKYIRIESNSTKPSEGDLECTIHPIVGMAASNNNSITRNSIIFEDGDVYTAESLNETDSFNVEMQFGDSYMCVNTKSGGKAIFENKKSLTLSNPSGQEYEAKFTLNDESVILPWYTITATGTGTKELKLEATDDGIVITGDDLSDLTVKGNNTTEIVELTVNSKYNKILITADKEGKVLVAYADVDGDGIFETLLGEENDVSEENKEETEQKQTTKNVKTGDSVKYFVIGLIISSIIAICAEVIKFITK